MSNSDKEVLEEFETWRAELIGNGADLSVAAFLKEREDDHNRLRIADVLGKLNDNILGLERNEEEGEWSELERRMLVLIRGVRDILEGDRPHEEITTLTSDRSTRVYR